MNSIHESERARKVGSFLVMDVMARAGELERQGRSIVHLQVGEPDFDTPAVVRRAAVEAMEKGDTHYTHAMGTPELREEICRFYESEYGVSITPDRVMVTGGTSPAMLLMMLAATDPGDEVLLTDPHYACYPSFVEGTGAVPRYLQLQSDDAFHLDIGRLQESLTDSTRAVMVNSPSNPTGIVLSGDELETLAAKVPGWIFSDEIYHGLTYGTKAHSILEYTDRAFVVNGFSKRWAMTGWRLGWLICPPEFSRTMERLHQNYMISASSFVQQAGIAALRHAGEEVERMRQEYDARRKLMLGSLRELGLTVYGEPRGAFYILADARHLCSDSLRESFDILEHAGVGVTPGIDFGTGAEGFLRFSYASSLNEIEEGMERLRRYLRTYKGCAV